MAPIVNGLEVEYFGSINFVHLDIEDPANEKFKKELGYRRHPHFILIDGEGNILQQWQGPVPVDDFRVAFDMYTE